ncbi:MAG: hypothetical protein LAO23_04450 [Acidobacteriia bacterium]|nr:hypothetical protein [Terriglobia bacterium]
MQTVSKTKEARRLSKLKRESESHESRNIAKRYKLPEAAVKLIEKAGPVYGQQSRAIQVAVELLWNMPGWGVSDESMSHILNSPLTGKTYKLPPRTVGLINGLALEYGTKGNVLAAIAHMLTADPGDSRPDLSTRLTRMPLPPPDKIVAY